MFSNNYLLKSKAGESGSVDKSVYGSQTQLTPNRINHDGAATTIEGRQMRLIEVFSGNSQLNSLNAPPETNAGYGPYQRKFVCPYEKPKFENHVLVGKKPYEKFLKRNQSKDSLRSRSGSVSKRYEHLSTKKAREFS